MNRGISLLEVLISIFVLSVGILGVFALIPAGHSEIAAASRIEHASMMGRAAFRDLKVRGFLDPTAWRLAGASVWQPFVAPPNWDGMNPPAHGPLTYDGGATHTNQAMLLLDPLGIAAGFGDDCPSGITGAPRLNRITTAALKSSPIADSVFRSTFDLVTEESDGSLLPKQVWSNGQRRATRGDYSWFATIISDPTHAEPKSVTVSIAVFHKRDLSTPATAEANYVMTAGGSATGVGVGGGDLRLIQSAGQPDKEVKPGQWILLARHHNTQARDMFRWYRVVSAAKKAVGSQGVTLAGTDWDAEFISGSDPDAITRAFLFDGIVAVYEKNLTLLSP